MRILHLGLGSFHRAHQAVYLQRLHDAGDLRWSLVGANLRPDMDSVVSAMQAQHCRYTLETIAPNGRCDYQTISAIGEVMAFDAGLQGVVRCGADAATRIISFTVTEAGYYLDATGHLDLDAPEVASDIQALQRGGVGSTLYGVVAAMLRARLQNASGPVTLLNCDNLRHNGDRFYKGLTAFLARCNSGELLDWAHAHVSCPNAMVDRITPRPPPELRARVLAATGVDDAAAVSAEHFIQWVIEDRFPAGRPNWEHVGVDMVDAVAPYEEAKIRILNASHSCIAWAGTLCGLTFIHQGARTPAIRQMVVDYVTNDVIPCLSPPGRPSPLDLHAYRDSVLERFGNPALQDTNQRVAADGFSKIPGFIAPTLRQRLAAGETADSVAVLPALFLAFLQRWHGGDLPYTYQDQAMNEAAAHAICTASDPVAALCADAALWGDIAGNAHMVQAVRATSKQVQHFIQEHSA